MGILLFGSQVDESPSVQSDVDICIVSSQIDVKENLSEAWKVVGGKYDLWMFEELPVYYYEKLVQTYRYRLRVAYGEF